MSLQTFGRIAAGELGTVERYSNVTKYGAWYGMQGAPYCAIGLSWVAARSGDLTAFGGKWAYCPSWVSWFKRHGQWGRTPRVGAVVFFSFGHREAIHVEWVESVHTGYITTIGFNTSPNNRGSQNNGGGVYRRTRSSWGVEGYGYPAYAASRPSRSAPRKPVPQSRRVRLKVDGDFGPATRRRLQQWAGVTQDGVLGRLSWAAIQRKVGVSVDGIPGRNTWVRLQRLIGAKQDGTPGPATYTALQRYLNSH